MNADKQGVRQRTTLERDPWRANFTYVRLETTMTIDERLERLTERHEALAQSLELLSHEVRETRAAAEALVVAVQTGR